MRKLPVIRSDDVFYSGFRKKKAKEVSIHISQRLLGKLILTAMEVTNGCLVHKQALCSSRELRLA